MTAIITGSFDPVTLGHLDIVKRASEGFEKVTVLLCENFYKTPRFSIDFRLEMLKEATKGFENVEVKVHKGWLFEYLKNQKDAVLYKGVRNESDEEYEKKMADFNFDKSGVKTIMVKAKPEFEDVSSTLVYSLIESGGDWQKYLHPTTVKLIEKHI